MTTASLVRLNKYISECSEYSRRQADELITSGRVKVNGKTTKELGTKIHPNRDKISIAGETLERIPKGLMLVNKPKGMITSLKDPEGRRSIKEFLTKKYSSYFPVGRLDWNTSGLLILTNDGDLANHLMHPSQEFERVYEVKVRGRIGERVVDRISKGVKLPDGLVKAEVEVLEEDENKSLLMITVKEGRNRLVRRLMERTGHPVTDLKRIAFGPFTLGKLKTGEKMVLSEKLYKAYRRKIFSWSVHHENEKAEICESGMRTTRKSGKPRSRSRLSGSKIKK